MEGLSLHCRLIGYTRADELLVHVHKMARRDIFLTHDIHCCPNSFYLFYPTSVSTSWGKCVYIHTSDCVQTVYELRLLPNNTAMRYFYTNR